MTYLAACCTVKDEASCILEWMAFHRAAGVEKLIIIDNGSTDDTVDIIRSFRDQASVDLILWPDRDTQVSMYDHVLKHYRSTVEWCAFIDADEFLYPTTGTDLRVVLADYPHIGALGAHWHIYGSNGHIAPPGGLLIEAFTRRAEDDFLFNRHVKSIVRLRHAVRPLTSHLFEVKHGIYDDAGNDLHMGPPYGFFEHKPATYQKVRINHYHVRAAEEYASKGARGYFGADDEKLKADETRAIMFQLHDRNEVLDDSAQRFLPLMSYYLAT